VIKIYEIDHLPNIPFDESGYPLHSRKKMYDSLTAQVVDFINSNPDRTHIVGYSSRSSADFFKRVFPNKVLDVMSDNFESALNAVKNNAVDILIAPIQLLCTGVSLRGIPNLALSCSAPLLPQTAVQFAHRTDDSSAPLFITFKKISDTTHILNYTPAKWRSVKRDGYPSTDDFGPYPKVFVSMVCRGHEDWNPTVRVAELRFFGGDKNRPFWAGLKNENCAPIENDSWYVTHWAPCLRAPDPDVEEDDDECTSA